MVEAWEGGSVSPGGILLNSTAVSGSIGCVTTRILMAGGSDLNGIFEIRVANSSALNGCLSRKESSAEERLLVEDLPEAMCGSYSEMSDLISHELLSLDKSELLALLDRQLSLMRG